MRRKCVRALLDGIFPKADALNEPASVLGEQVNCSCDRSGFGLARLMVAVKQDYSWPQALR
jgi:hypothetical protein